MSISSRILSIEVALVAAALFSGTARAERSCPEQIPAAAAARKRVAGEWFDRAQAAHKKNRLEEAITAYSCSMRIVPHAFTAFNLAKAADAAGERAIAVESYRRYLELEPAAKDRDAVKARIAELEPPRRPPELAPEPTPEPAPPEPVPPVLEAPVLEAPQPSPIVAAAPAPERGGAYATAGWITSGGGLALTTVGVILNVLARGKADDARAFAAEDYDRAIEVNGEARSLAHGSYGLLGAGAAAIGAGVVLLLIE